MTERRPPTLKDVARMVGVSTATASNALSDKGRLSADMAARVRAAAEALGYVPGHAGRALRTGRSGTIGLVMPDFASPLFPLFTQAVERAAKRRGYAVLIADSMGDGADQQAEIAHLVERGIDGLVVVPLHGQPVDPRSVPVPLAIIDSAAAPDCTAASDHRRGGELIARHLLDLGHRRISILSGWPDSTVAGERLAGLRDVFDAAGVAVSVHAGPVTLEGGRAAVADGCIGDATAVAATYDAIAVGVLLELAARHVRVPEALSVTGFDDIVWGQVVAPPLTTIRQDLDAVTEHAIACLTGESTGRRLIPVELVVRGSSARAPLSRSAVPLGASSC